jgi:hypothetical protein
MRRRLLSFAFAASSAALGLAATLDAAGESNAAALTNCSFAAPGTAPQVSPVTAPPKTADWEHQYARAERQMFHLDASDAAIEHAAADPYADTSRLGTPLTQEEVKQMNAADQVRASATEINAFVNQSKSQSVATVFTDPADPGRIDINFIGTTCDELKTIGAAFPTAPVQPVHLQGSVSASASWSLLTALEGRLSELDKQHVLVDSAEVDEESGRLRVSFDSSTAAQSAASVLTSLGASSEAIDFSYGSEPITAVDQHINPDKFPLYAGEDVTDGADSCTSNISGINTVDNYWVTAGHCFLLNGGHLISQNGSDTILSSYDANKSAGTVGDRDPVANGVTINCDCQLIGGISNDRRSQDALVNDNGIRIFHFIADDPQYFAAGSAVCTDGMLEWFAFGHVICGTTQVNSMSTTEFAKREDGSTIIFNVIDVMKIHYPDGVQNLPGDSGGPAWVEGDILDGLITGIGDDPSTTYISKARNIQNYYPHFSWLIPNT